MCIVFSVREILVGWGSKGCTCGRGCGCWLRCPARWWRARLPPRWLPFAPCLLRELSRTLHNTVRRWKIKFFYSHFGYSFTLYVLLYKIAVPARYIFDGEKTSTILYESVSRLQYVAVWCIAFYLNTVGFYSALATRNCVWHCIISYCKRDVCLVYCDQSNLYNTVFCTVMEQCRLFWRINVAVRYDALEKSASL